MSVVEKKLSTCALDCPDACSLVVTVENGRAVKLQGDPSHPVTQGFLCGKVSRYLEREYSPKRLLHPLKRTGPKGSGEFTQISWTEALAGISEELKRVVREHGPESVLPYSYAGTMGYLQGSGMDRRFFHRLGASRLDRTICASAGAAGLMEAYGVRLGLDPARFAEAKLILVWGANVLSTNVHLWPFLLEARRRGARIYTIDPVKTKIARLSDRHYEINPGSDLALALGLLHVIFAEELQDDEYIGSYTTGVESLRMRAAEYPPARVAELTGIAAEEIVSLAREYAKTHPSAIRVNYGVQRSERGGRAVRAIALLPAVTGAWRHRGGGLQLTTSGAFEVNRDALERPDLQQVALGREARMVNMSMLGNALTAMANPRVHALVVYNSNPAAIAPNQGLVHEGLRREDLFTVTLDHFMTDTAAFSDYVLPATTFLEHTDVYFAYGHYHLQLARPAVAPPGECRPNSEVFRDLARWMGFGDACFAESDEEMIRGLLETKSPYLAGITLERLEREHSIRLSVPTLPFSYGGFRTASGKCDLGAEELAYEPPAESRHGDERMRRDFPLELVSSKNHDSLNSSFGFREDTDAQCAVLEMHHEDAAPRGIAPGDEVEVFNGRGAIRLRAEVGEGVKRGVVRAPMVRWPSFAAERTNVNILVSDRLTDIGGGPTFYNCLVEVRKCAVSQ
jgi:anaerobic selenocysteine-containing dehydrogenase